MQNHDEHDGWVYDEAEIAEREAAKAEYRHIGQLCSAVTAIASEIEPSPASSPMAAKRWRACVAYMNEIALGEELEESRGPAFAEVSGYRVRPANQNDARMAALREWLSLEEAV